MPVAAGTALVFNGVTNQFYTTRLPFRDDCLSHETYPDADRVAARPSGHGRASSSPQPGETLGRAA